MYKDWHVWKFKSCIPQGTEGLLLAACEDVAKKESENQANILFHANPPIPWVKFLQSGFSLTTV